MRPTLKWVSTQGLVHVIAAMMIPFSTFGTQALHNQNKATPKAATTTMVDEGYSYFQK
jgi:hypothetical protein